MTFFEKKELKIFLSFFLLYFIFIQWIGEGETSRLDLVRAIVNDSDIKIDKYRNNTGDRDFINGHYYSDPAPGLSIFSVPTYTTLKFFYVYLYPKEFDFPSVGKSIRYENNAILFDDYKIGSFDRLAIILLPALTSSLFGALSIVLIFKLLTIVYKINSILPVLVYGLGTLIFPWSLIFFGVMTATFFGLLSFYLIKVGNSKLLYIIGGIFSGLAVSIDYTLLLFSFGFLCLMYFENKKFVIAFLLGLVIGLLPLFVYNFLVFSNPLNITLLFSDNSVLPRSSGFPQVLAEDELLKINIFSVAERSVEIIPKLLFSEYRGLFFYYPILIFSFLGFYYFYKKQKVETVVFIMFFIVCLVFSSILLRWWGGTSFGPRRLTYVVPFLMIPFAFFVENNKKNKLILTCLLVLSIISIFYNLLSLQDPEGINLVYNNETQNYEFANQIENPLYQHYLPLTMIYGTRSRIFEGLTKMEIPDIRDFTNWYVPHYLEILTFSKGIVVLKLTFLIIPILVILILLIWREDIFKLFKVPSFFIILLIIAVLLSSLDTIPIVFDQNWLPVKMGNMHEISNNASLTIMNQKNTEQSVNFLFTVISSNGTHPIMISTNDSYKTVNISEEPTQFMVHLINHQTPIRISFKTVENCDQSINVTSNECVSFWIGNFAIIKS